MERNIPHVLDIFGSSPGERRRIVAKEREEEKFARQLKDQQKNPGSDSAVCLCSSSDEDERNISKFFDYLNEEFEDTSSSPKKKKTSKSSSEKKSPQQDGESDSSPPQKQQKVLKESNGNKENVRAELEKDIKQIERHLSMKKTIRKKMMRDLQQAFVEDPKEFQQDPECIPPERKNNINIHNLTISKRRMSKSEHSFLDMLKENEHKDRKSHGGRSAPSDPKAQKNHAHSKRSVTSSSSRNKHHEDDSGNDSPTRSAGPPSHSSKHAKEKTQAPAPPPKEEKKASFWQRLTGKGKSKR